MKKNYLTLIEILISMVLSSLIISTLLGTYSFFSKTENVLLEQNNREKVYLYHRLKKMFSSLSPVSDSTVVFFTPSQEALYFSYHNGVNRNPIASLTVFTRLSLEGSSLMLDVWSEPKSGRYHFLRSETLLDDVEDFKIECFNEKEGLFELWDHQNLPSVISISYAQERKKNEKLIFVIDQHQQI